jgi:hypothetical protein
VDTLTGQQINVFGAGSTRLDHTH